MILGSKSGPLLFEDSQVGSPERLAKCLMHAVLFDLTIPGQSSSLVLSDWPNLECFNPNIKGFASDLSPLHWLWIQEE